jgi:hypothetical protein
LPGQNLHKLSKAELNELRAIVKREYFGDFNEKQLKAIDERELDKLIDSLLPATVEKCKEIGAAKGFIASKKFFLPSKIVAANGKPIMREDG